MPTAISSDAAGTLRATKAIGWYIEEYGIAQVSMNITDIAVTPLHVAFDEVCRKADARGVRVTGTEIVGLVPKRALLERAVFPPQTAAFGGHRRVRRSSASLSSRWGWTT